MAPSLYQSSWKHNRLMTDTPFSKKELGVGCGGCSHDLEVITVCNRVACTPAPVKTECQQFTHRQSASPGAQRGVAQTAKRKHILRAIHSTVRAGLGCQDPHHHLKHGRSGKQTHFPPDHLLPYQIGKVSMHLPPPAVSVIRNKDRTLHPARQALPGWLTF